VLNIVKGQRVSKVKDCETKKKWDISDIHKVKGIAIAVPFRYAKNVEDLVVLIPRLSILQKEVLKSKSKPVPKQLDVQLLI
jgi:hypothetical protein